ncbi:MAG TPA: hypothetical protein VFD52_00085, partial [Clostridia bacterium]|nr:hypothetical protein [Clostridia bacterium]
MNEIIKAVKNLLSEKRIITLAIDGMSAAGKSTLANELSKRFDSNVFHMDDFFLTGELRTPQRLKQVGGNVDYVRFKDEVLEKIKLNEPFSYRAYSCVSGEFSKREVMPKKFNIVEGAYSLHPTLLKFYDYKIMIKT